MTFVAWPYGIVTPGNGIRTLSRAAAEPYPSSSRIQGFY